MAGQAQELADGLLGDGALVHEVEIVGPLQDGEVEAQRRAGEPDIEVNHLRRLRVGPSAQRQPLARRRDHAVADAGERQQVEGLLECRRTLLAIDLGIGELLAELIGHAVEHRRQSMVVDAVGVLGEVVAHGGEQFTVNVSDRQV